MNSIGFAFSFSFEKDDGTIDPESYCLIADTAIINTSNKRELLTIRADLFAVHKKYWHLDYYADKRIHQYVSPIQPRPKVMQYKFFDNSNVIDWTATIMILGDQTFWEKMQRELEFQDLRNAGPDNGPNLLLNFILDAMKTEYNEAINLLTTRGYKKRLRECLEDSPLSLGAVIIKKRPSTHFFEVTHKGAEEISLNQAIRPRCYGFEKLRGLGSVEQMIRTHTSMTATTLLEQIGIAVSDLSKEESNQYHTAEGDNKLLFISNEVIGIIVPTSEANFNEKVIRNDRSPGSTAFNSLVIRIEPPAQ